MEHENDVSMEQVRSMTAVPHQFGLIVQLISLFWHISLGSSQEQSAVVLENIIFSSFFKNKPELCFEELI